MNTQVAHSVSHHALALAFAAFVALAVYVLSGATYGWFVLEQRAFYGVSGPLPDWHQPTMLAPAILIGLFIWSRAEAESRRG